ncbi:protein matrimony [Scaptodrosophila lebanonensis]|uniref:Protein matrimony n=1 Tax=Drosophila lebanonensis TaxID=7225 RepID=A0A6J2TCH9_DROLE|nr:protein matrimony [Scaptodrosophila lebanonensis]
MEECRTPTNNAQFTFTRTPTLRRDPKWNGLKVNTLNVRCSTPIRFDFRSPNLSPIKNALGCKSPATPMCATMFKKPILKQQQQQQRPLMAIKTAKTAVKLPKKLDKSNCSFELGSDDSSSSGNSTDNSLCSETRRLSIRASNHSYVVNHAVNVEDVLIRVGLENYMDTFLQAKIEVADLVCMGRDDLKNMGLRREEDCTRILEVLRTL